MPLNTSTLTRLRAFEAVGRLLSFTNAASELGVTPTALSHHVRHLEGEIGVALVVRLHRRIALTQEGRVLLDACTQGFTAIGQAIDAVVQQTESAVLTIDVAPYFSARWLTPRLSNFWNLHPDIDVHLHHAYQLADFSLDRADAAIAWGSGSWPGVEAERILEGTLIPLCSPTLRDTMPTHPTTKDLSRHKLLYEFSFDHWQQWFEAAGTPMPPNTASYQIDDSQALRKMVLEGEGIALFFKGLSREDRQLGHLVQPLEIAIDPGNAYYLTRPVQRQIGRHLAAFRDWLLDEISLDPHA